MTQNSRAHFTQFMLMVVSLMGIISVVSLINEPLPTENFEYAAAEPGQYPNRQIASILDSAVASVPQPAIDVLDFACDVENQNLTTPNTRVRIRGDICLTGELDKQSTQVRNTSNGFAATVFRRAPSGFTTDYINLSEGNNQIEIVFKVGNAETKKILNIQRSPASEIKK